MCCGVGIARCSIRYCSLEQLLTRCGDLSLVSVEQVVSNISPLFTHLRYADYYAIVARS